VISSCLAPADAHEPAYSTALLRRAPEHPDVKSYEEQGRAKSEQEIKQGIAAFFDRFRADFDPVADQKCFQARVYEGWHGSREVTNRFGRVPKNRGPLALRFGFAAGRRTLFVSGSGLAAGHGTLFVRRRIGDRRLEAARDGLALAMNRFDVALADLLLEKCVGHCNRR